jgi:hypothetical protein
MNIALKVGGVLMGLTLLAMPAEAGPVRFLGSLRENPESLVTLNSSVQRTFVRRSADVWDVLFRTAVREEQKFAFWVSNREVVAVEGRTVEDVAILSELGLGAEVLEIRTSDNAVLIVGVHTSKGVGGDWYRVRVKTNLFGWIPVSQVDVVHRAPLGETLEEVRNTFHGTVRSLSPARFSETATRLEGAVLGRLKGSGTQRLGDDPRRVDILTLSLRFHEPKFPSSSATRTGDQDLVLVADWDTAIYPLWATVLSVGHVLGFSGLNTTDFLKSSYYSAASDYIVEGEPVLLRARPRNMDYLSPGSSRAERLQNALESGHAVFVLEARPRSRGQLYEMSEGSDLGSQHSWISLAEITLTKDAQASNTLVFDSAKTGRGLEPGPFLSTLDSLFRDPIDEAKKGVVQRLESSHTDD